MKPRICLGALAFPLLTLVPAIASENEFSYDEFEINNLPEAQEEESSWEFSFGIEGVYGQTKTSAYVEEYTSIPGSYWWEDDTIIGGVARKTDFVGFYGCNFRFNWLRKAEGDSPLLPEIYALLGFMMGRTENPEKDMGLLQCSAGANIHLLLSNNISVFGGVRLGGGGLVGHKDIALNPGVLYGIGAGVQIKIGSRESAIRLGIDHLSSTSEINGDGGLYVSEPTWTVFTLGYSTSF